MNNVVTLKKWHMIFGIAVVILTLCWSIFSTFAKSQYEIKTLQDELESFSEQLNNSNLGTQKFRLDNHEARLSNRDAEMKNINRILTEISITQKFILDEIREIKKKVK